MVGDRHLQYNELQQWYSTAPGNWLLALEQEQVAKWVSLSLDHVVLQLGGFPHMFGFTKRYPEYYFNAAQCEPGQRDVSVVSDYDCLPFVPESVNFTLLIHLLEFCENPIALLKHVYDLLAPGGQLLLLTFNPWSIWGLQAWLGKKTLYPWQGHFISPIKLQYWLRKLAYIPIKDKTFCFRGSFIKQPVTKTTLFFEALGQILVPMLGAVTISLLEKRIYGTIKTSYQQSFIQGKPL